MDLQPKDFNRYNGMTVNVSRSVPIGSMYIVGTQYKSLLVHPDDWVRLVKGIRTPLWTRHMLGVRELERDKRKYGR